MSVFAVLEDLDVRVVRAEVAGRARVGLARLSDTEEVSSVAGGAIPRAAVRVDVPHPGIWPGFGARPVVLVQRDLGSVALHAAGLERCSLQIGNPPTLMHLDERVEVVLRDDLVVCAEVAAGFELLELEGMAAPAGGRRHEDGNEYVDLVSGLLPVTLG